MAESPDGNVVGWVHASVRCLVESDPEAEIGGLVVDERCRSRGVGAALVRRAEQWVRSKGLTEIVVHTNVVRTRAHGFYERCGYQLLKQSMVYTKEIR